jgi:predicted O-methyltransferase YrrM
LKAKQKTNIKEDLMKVHPYYPRFLPVFLRAGWGLSKKINKLLSKLLTIEEIMQLDDIEGQTNLAQCATLFYFAYTNLKLDGRIVEIGSFRGKSTCWMAKAIALAKSSEKVVAIDPHNSPNLNRKTADYAEADWQSFLNNLNNCAVTKFVEPLKKTSIDAAVNWNESIKVIFIDGSHLYDDVILDLQNWEPHLRVGGILIMHDTKPEGEDNGAYYAMNDYVLKSKRFEKLLMLKNMSCFIKTA